MPSSHATRGSVILALTVLSLFGGPSSAGAQLAEASASTLALSGAQTATAREFASLSVNPAGLGMPGSGFSLALVPVRARFGSGPVGPGSLADYQDRVVPAEVKEAWLREIGRAGGQSALAGADVSGIALTVASFGLQVSTSAVAEVRLPPDVAESLLFGNAGRTGAAADLDLTGLVVDAFATSTVALGAAVPLGPVVVGVTGKYIVGHALAIGRSTSGALSSDPVRLDLQTPVAAPCDDELVGGCRDRLGRAGDGIGLDVGLMTTLGRFHLGAAVSHVVNTFSWDTEALSFRPGSTLIERSGSRSDFEERAFSGAPAELRSAVESFGFGPLVRLGASMDVTNTLTVSTDLHRRFEEERVAAEPRSRVAAGAEWRGVRFLHLRAGAAIVSGGAQWSGGASLVLGPVNLSAAAARRDRDRFRSTTLAQFTLSFGGR